MNFRDNVFFYINENKKKEDEEFKMKKEAGCEADGSSCATADDGHEASKSTEKCPKCGKKACECSCKTKEKKCPKCGKFPCVCASDDTEEASTVADYDKRRAEQNTSASNEKPGKGSIKGYELGSARGIGGGRKQNTSKFHDYGSQRAEQNTSASNEKPGKGSMKGYSLKESIAYYSDAIVSEEQELINESLKNKAASKKLMKLSKRYGVLAAKTEDPNLRNALKKDEELFRKAYYEISEIENRAIAGDPAAKRQFKEASEKYKTQFKVVNKGKLGKYIASGVGAAALLSLIGAALFVGLQGVFEPGAQLEGIGKLTINSPLDGIKNFFGLGKKIVDNDHGALSAFLSKKDINDVKDYLADKQDADFGAKDTVDNMVNHFSKTGEATSGKGAVKNAVKDWMKKMSTDKSGDGDESAMDLKNAKNI